MKGARGATKGHKLFVARLVPFNATTKNLCTVKGAMCTTKGK